MHKFMVEIESNTDSEEEVAAELAIAICAIESETELDIIQVELAN